MPSRRNLMRLITMKTAECEGLEQVGAKLADASVARVKEVEWIAGGHNQIVVVETARYGTKRVVCGAPNCKPGMLTAYLPLAPMVIEGVESDGMLASAMELGIGGDHTGIVELESEALLTPDTVIEVDNKSLTHRPDLWGHHGMAREVAAITHRKLRDPVKLDVPKGKAAIGIDIEDFALCPRYSALVFENVTVRPSPLWLQYRLEAIGLNAINNIVDVTNYVMAELAQPMHAFDAEKLHGPTIFVRNARPGEKIVALNDESYDLSPSNLVIADAEGPIALAGVIGGLHSAIGPDTKRIVLESANFQAASVRKTSVALKLRTDASMRFEKSQDPLNTVRGLARALELLARGFAWDSAGRRRRGFARRVENASHDRTDGRLVESQAGPRSGCAARCARFSNRSNSASKKPRPATSWLRCRAGAPPKTSRSKTTCSKKSAALSAMNPSRRRRR